MFDHNIANIAKKIAQLALFHPKEKLNLNSVLLPQGLNCMFCSLNRAKKKDKLYVRSIDGKRAIIG
jgi:hypothetical protein